MVNTFVCGAFWLSGMRELPREGSGGGWGWHGPFSESSRAVKSVSKRICEEPDLLRVRGLLKS